MFKGKGKMLCLLLAVVLCLLPLGGCVIGSDTQVIATVEGEDVPAGVYLYYLLNGYLQAASLVENPYADPLGQQVDGQPAEEYIAGYAMDEFKKYAATGPLFEELGLALTTAETASVISSLESSWESNQALFTDNGISRESLEKATYATLQQQLIYDYYYGEDGTEKLSDQQLADHFQAEYARVSMLVFEKFDESGIALEESAMQQVRDQAEGYLQRAMAGEDFDGLAIEWETQQLGDSFDPEGEDLAQFGHSHDDPFAHDTIIHQQKSYMPAGFLEEAFAAPVGEAQLYEDNYYLVVYLRKDILANPEDLETYRAVLTSDLAMPLLEEKLLARAAQLELVFNEKAVKRYTPDQVDLGSLGTGA